MVIKTASTCAELRNPWSATQATLVSCLLPSGTILGGNKAALGHDRQLPKLWPQRSTGKRTLRCQARHPNKIPGRGEAI